MIPESFIQDLLNRIDIVEVVGRYVQLKKGGANMIGLCPFHGEKTPSFTVSPAKQFYHCFGCGAHGNAIGFMMQQSGQTFPDAVRALAHSVGMAVPETQPSPVQQKKRQIQQTLTSVCALAQQHYQQLLSQSPDIIQYLQQRGLTPEIAHRFGIGWSGHSPNDLLQVIGEAQRSLLLESGLMKQQENGLLNNRFRSRVMFPIRTIKGEIIAFGGRITNKSDHGPKYLNSPETPIFQKKQELYGIYENHRSIRKEDQVIVVEGYMDVVGLAQNGVDIAVATLGTATSEFHIQKLIRLAHKVIFAFDGDQAGRKAAWRALVTCLPYLKEDIAFRFLFLPPEHDPDSYVKSFGQAAFREQLKHSVALSQFFVDHLSHTHPLHEAEGRMACLHEARPLLQQIKNSSIQSQFVREMASLIKLTYDELLVAIQPTPNDVLEHPTSVVPVQPKKQYSRKARPVQTIAFNRRPRELLQLVVLNIEFVKKISDTQFEILTSIPHMRYVCQAISMLKFGTYNSTTQFVQSLDRNSELYIAIQDALNGHMVYCPANDSPEAIHQWERELPFIWQEIILNEEKGYLGQRILELGALLKDETKDSPQLREQLQYCRLRLTEIERLRDQLAN